MKLGFIGTGKITSSVITGICNSSIKYNRIFVSSRNNKISKNLKKRFKKISIEKNNQKIIKKTLFSTKLIWYYSVLAKF